MHHTRTLLQWPPYLFAVLEARAHGLHLLRRHVHSPVEGQCEQLAAQHPGTQRVVQMAVRLRQQRGQQVQPDLHDQAGRRQAVNQARCMIDLVWHWNKH